MPEHLPIALRVYPQSVTRKPKRRGRYRRPNVLFVFDAETTVDPSQALTFGTYQVCRLMDGRLGHVADDYRLIEEGLFHADDLKAKDLETVQQYAREHGIQCHSRKGFIHKVFLPWAYKLQALVIGFNLPFDISRIAVQLGEARRGRTDQRQRRSDIFAGGFSFSLDQYLDNAGRLRDNPYRPRIAVKTIDSKRHVIGFKSPLKGAEKKAAMRDYFSGHFLDVRTLVFALTDKGHTLASACEAFGVEHRKLEGIDHRGEIAPDYIDYNRRDVLATFEVAVNALAEYDLHPISPGALRPERARRTLQETQAYSPASLGKAYLRAFGVRPILERQRFQDKDLGHAMLAFYGGRAECRIRCAPVPVVYLDFVSMYPTVDTLMALWHFQTAERIDIVDATDEVRRFLDGLTLDDLFRPETWPALTSLVEVEPKGDILPVRARYEVGAQDWQIGINPLWSKQPLWYALADLAASKLRTGRAPTIRRAVRFVPRGRARGLRPATLPGGVTIDPRRDDFFRKVIEERKRAAQRDLSQAGRERLSRFLKVLANATSYGIFAEMNRHELPSGEKERATVYGLRGTFDCSVSALEEPGEYFFAPIAAFITAAARLMLAMLGRTASGLGGTYAMCDTDSMAIVATKAGGTVKVRSQGADGEQRNDTVCALSWRDVEAIRARFAALNPYNRELVPGSILKLEDVNKDPISGEQRQLYCYAISAKRYCLYTLGNDGRPIVKAWRQKPDEELGDEEGDARELSGERTWSEHGLGHLMNPTDSEAEDRGWIRQCWEGIVREALGKEHSVLPLLDRPALAKISGSTPAMLRPFASLNKGLVYDRQVKPFNFLMSAQVGPLGHPPNVDPQRFHLIAPFNKDARQWRKLRWIERYSRKSYTIATNGQPSVNVVRVKSYGDVLREYATHPEPKSLGPDGTPCTRLTKGLLRQRPVEALPFGDGLSVYIGKESNRLEDVQAGLVQDVGDVLAMYEDPRDDAWRTYWLPKLREVPVAELQRISGMSRTRVYEMLAGRSVPRRERRERLICRLQEREQTPEMYAVRGDIGAG